MSALPFRVLARVVSDEFEGRVCVCERVEAFRRERCETGSGDRGERCRARVRAGGVYYRVAMYEKSRFLGVFVVCPRCALADGVVSWFPDVHTAPNSVH